MNFDCELSGHLEGGHCNNIKKRRNIMNQNIEKVIELRY